MSFSLNNGIQRKPGPLGNASFENINVHNALNVVNGASGAFYELAARTGSFSMTFSAPGWASNQICNVQYSKVGNIITLYFPSTFASVANAGVANNSIASTTPWPSYATPLQIGNDATASSIVVLNASSFAAGTIFFSNTLINIYSGVNSDFSTTAATNFGWQTPIIITYQTVDNS